LFVSPGWLRTMILLISTSHTVWGDRHMQLHPIISWDGVLLTFWMVIFPISASQVVGITGMSHQHVADIWSF
jgi:hypothetical protein